MTFHSLVGLKKMASLKQNAAINVHYGIMDVQQTSLIVLSKWGLACHFGRLTLPSYN